MRLRNNEGADSVPPPRARGGVRHAKGARAWKQNSGTREPSREQDRKKARRKAPVLQRPDTKRHLGGCLWPRDPAMGSVAGVVFFPLTSSSLFLIGHIYAPKKRPSAKGRRRSGEKRVGERGF